MIRPKKFTKVGIVGFGGYVPKYRIKTKAIATARGKNGSQIVASLGVKQKAVADKDEDTVSLSVEAATRALSRSSKLVPEKLGAVLVGSESHPYAVKPTGSIVAQVLGIGNDYLTADLEFACKAGTTGIVMIAAMIEAGLIDCGLAIGADVAQSEPGDALEYTAGAGAAAVILGNQKYPWWAKLNAIGSFNSDTPDFWRRSGEKYPSHAGRFTGEPAYYACVLSGTQKFLQNSKRKINSFDQVILHMPNAKFPQRVAVKMGASQKQLSKGFLVPQIGNPYSASAMMGLVKVLEESKKGEEVLLTSYGSGAGSDSLSLSIVKKMTKKSKEKNIPLKEQLANVEYINYSKYLQLKGLR